MVCQIYNHKQIPTKNLTLKNVFSDLIIANISRHYIQTLYNAHNNMGIYKYRQFLIQIFRVYNALFSADNIITLLFDLNMPCVQYYPSTRRSIHQSIIFNSNRPYIQYGTLIISCSINNLATSFQYIEYWDNGQAVDKIRYDLVCAIQSETVCVLTAWCM